MKYAGSVARALVMLVLVCLCFNLPSARSATARQLVEVVDFSGLSLSADGRYVVFRTEQASIERNTYDSVWYVQPTDGSLPPRRLGEGGVPLRSGGLSIPEIPVWSPNGEWIFYRAFINGRIDVWRAATDGSKAEPVTKDPANIREFVLSADGSELYYSAGASREEIAVAELDEYARGIHVDRTVPLGDSIFRSGFHDGRLATQRFADQRGRNYQPLLAHVPKQWKKVDLHTGAIEEVDTANVVRSVPFHPPDVKGDIRRVAKDPDSNRAAVIARRGDRDGLRDRPIVDLEVYSGQGQAIRCRAVLCVGRQITDVVWRPGSDEVIFTVSDRKAGLGQSILRWNTVSFTVTPVVETRGELGGGGHWQPGPCAASFEVMICVATEADRPPRLERVDIESGKREVLFDPNVALAADMAELPSADLLIWTDTDGSQFSGQFFPAVGSNQEAPPLFIAYYWCSGFLRGAAGDEWPLATLARHGISTLCINAAHARTDAIERYELGRSAIESAVELLASRGAIDPGRVGIGGLSLGAEVAMWSREHSRVPAAVSVASPVISPLFHLVFSLWGEEHLSRLNRFWQLGIPEDTPERWKQLAPIYGEGRDKAPVLMQMGEQEFRASLDYSVPMIQAGEADMYVFPHEAHQKYQPQHKLAAYERNLDWFRFWLQGVEDNDGTKVDQFERWRSMRDRELGEST